MMGLPLGMVVEGMVSILLLVTIGYSIMLNERLKKLHADKDALKAIIADLVMATDSANTAIRELRQTADEAETNLSGRLEEAERFAVELANHVTSGQAVMDRIARILSTVRQAEANGTAVEAPVVTNRAKEALARLRSHQMRKDEAA